jgi:hypothetical protein
MILEERRRRLLPEHVEMLACIKGWELGERRLQHSTDNQELASYFEHQYLGEKIQSASGAPSAGTSVASASTSAGTYCSLF